MKLRKASYSKNQTGLASMASVTMGRPIAGYKISESKINPRIAEFAIYQSHTNSFAVVCIIHRQEKEAHDDTDGMSMTCTYVSLVIIHVHLNCDPKSQKMFVYTYDKNENGNSGDALLPKIIHDLGDDWSILEKTIEEEISKHIASSQEDS